VYFTVAPITVHNSFQIDQIVSTIYLTVSDGLQISIGTTYDCLQMYRAGLIFDSSQPELSSAVDGRARAVRLCVGLSALCKFYGRHIAL
jgi:hypothetical protein